MGKTIQHPEVQELYNQYLNAKRHGFWRKATLIRATLRTAHGFDARDHERRTRAQQEVQAHV